VPVPALRHAGTGDEWAHYAYLGQRRDRRCWCLGHIVVLRSLLTGFAGVWGKVPARRTIVAMRLAHWGTRALHKNLDETVYDLEHPQAFPAQHPTDLMGRLRVRLRAEDHARARGRDQPADEAPRLHARP
jgi:hypothetical protein